MATHEDTSKRPSEIHKDSSEIRACLEEHSLPKVAARLQSEDIAAAGIGNKHRQAEEKLIEQALTLANIKDAVIGMDMDYRINYWSPSAEKMYGYRAEEVLGRSSLEVFKPDYMGTPRDEVLDSLRSTGQIRVEAAHFTKDGRRIIVESHSQLLYDKDGRPYGLLGTNRDTTERKEAEIKLKKHIQCLEDLIQEQTCELEAANDKLQAEVAEHKRTEEILHESEEKFRALSDTSPAAILVYRNNRFLYVNQAATSICGYTKEELLTMDFIDIIHPDYQGEMKRWIKLQMDGYKEQLHCEVVIVTRTGDERWLDVSSNTIHYGDLPAGITICLDITERKRSEEALRESEEKFRAMADCSVVSISLYQDSRIIYANEASTAIFGYSLDERQRMSLDELMHPDYIEKTRRRMKVLLEDGSDNQQNEYKIIRKNGEERWVLSSGAPLTYRGRPAVMVATIDITDRKQAEEWLQRSNDELELHVQERTKDLQKANEILREGAERFRRTFDQSPIGATIVSLDYRFLQANPAYCSIVGYSEEELLKLTFVDITYPDDLEANLEQTRRVARGELDRYQMDKRLIRKDGRIVWICLSVGTVKDASGMPLYYLSMIEDITERKKVEEALRAAKEAAEAAVEAKAAFMANMSHELRTPMNAVMGMTSLLLEEPLTPEQMEYVEIARKGGEAMLAHINNLLDFSRAEKEEIELYHRPFSIKTCIDEALSLVSTQANKRGLNLVASFRYGTPDVVLGDSGRLRQILVNLLSNAIKFTDKGELSISVSSKYLEAINKYQILFEVKDTGIGIPPEKMDQLFKPFSQIEMTLSRKHDGFGLGLAICKKLAQLMGGTIWARSEPGRGSTFYFTIEAEEALGLPDRPEIKASFVGNMAQQHPLRILVAEDNPSNQKVLVEMLRRMGYRADAVADGTEVLLSLESRSYDLIFMDVRMPEMDGMAAAREIRKRWPLGPKIVAMTAYAMSGDKEKFIEAGMDDYISKPLRKGELAEMLKKCSHKTQ